MRRNILYLLLAISVPVCLHFSSVAQEREGNAGNKDTAPIEKRGGEKTDASADRDIKPSNNEQTPSLDKGDDRRTGAAVAKKDVKKKTERKKKEVKKQLEKKAEEKKKETVKKEETQGDFDRESGDNLLLIDHENIQYDRIPGITIKTEEPGQDLVKIPDDKITGKKKEQPKSGLFGSKTGTIARWGLLILLFLIFIIYKTRVKKSRKKVVRTITKR